MKAKICAILVVCFAVSMAMPPKVETSLDDNLLEDSALLNSDELWYNYNNRIDSICTFGKLTYPVWSYPTELVQIQDICNRLKKNLKQFIATAFTARGIEELRFHPKRSLDSIGGGHLIKRK